MHGRRLLPIIVKDVAGLVPGAYKGRGKGNRFLADLCDADVLVHVVDATGRADRDGNVLVGGEKGKDQLNVFQ
jgi:ribosome-binding ATPase YchF (GTP1/OBG family)